MLSAEEKLILDKFNLLLKMWGLGTIKKLRDGNFYYRHGTRHEIYYHIDDVEFWTFHNIRSIQT